MLCTTHINQSENVITIKLKANNAKWYQWNACRRKATTPQYDTVQKTPTQQRQFLGILLAMVLPWC